MLTTLPGTTNPLIAAVVADFKAGNRAGDATRAPAGPRPGEGRDVTALLALKAPGEAEGFKRWLLGTAQRTAEAAKEGGVFGIGGVSVSDAEKAALGEVAGALGLKA